MKKTHHFLLAASIPLAMAFTFSCSSDIKLPPDEEPISSSDVSSSSSDFIVAGESSSSVDDGGGGNSSSSGNPGSSSSSVTNNSGSSSSSSGCIDTPPPTNSPVSYYGKLKASGNKLVGSKTCATPVQVRGVSLFWSNTGWGGDRFFNKTTVDAMAKDWKAEIIRVPMGYDILGGGGSSDNQYSGSYLDDKTGNMNRIKAAINAAIANDVYVIIDWHSHRANSGQSDAIAFFTEMAQTYGSKDHVIFEIFNEPLNISWATIKTYATSVIAAIRQYSDNLILVGTPNWSQDVNVAANSPISDTKNNIVNATVVR